MLEMSTNNVNVNVSNVTGESKVDGKIVATFNSNFSSGMMESFSTSKNIIDMAAYDANAEAVEADYAEFEAAARQMVASVTAAVKGSIVQEEELTDKIY